MTGPETGWADEPLPASYVLPLAATRPVIDADFVAYLRWVAARTELIVVDGSGSEVFGIHDSHWGGIGRHVRPSEETLVGKVGNVMTGVRLARHDRVVIADDDVRFGPELAELVRRLDEADVVRPQNYFDPLPWHAAWDSGRSLLNRVSGGDWPGTLAIRRCLLLAAGGYAGDVMFENYEMARTIEAAGGCHVVAPDVFVRRCPPTARHFLSQRVRQAYDELARPARLAGFLAVLPVGAALVATGRGRTLGRFGAVWVVVLPAVAEVGRRRDGAAAFFPFRCSLLAPMWAAERSVCSWAALWARAGGGVRYRGRRVRRAALGSGERRRRVCSALARSVDPGRPGRSSLCGGI